MAQKPGRVRTGDAALIKEINRNIILNHIRRNAPISRAMVAERSGLNRATVSAIVEDLIREKLVFELGPGESRGGKKPILLKFNALAGLCIGMDIGVNYLRLLLTDLEGRIMARDSLPVLPGQQAEEVLGLACSAVKKMLAGAPSTAHGLAGIGIGLPGLVDYGSGTLVFAPNLGWREVPVHAIMREAFSCPVLIDNEANVGALGEMWFGSARNRQNFVYLSAGIGIGAGIVVQGEIFRGSGGFAGEVGHTTIDPGGPPCRCGNRGCWETLASEAALSRYAVGEGLTEGSGPGELLTPSRLAELASGGDERARRALERTGYYLGVGMANLINIFNPSLIVTGNSMAAGLLWLLPTIEQVIKERALSTLRAPVQLLPSALGEEAGAIGGVAMVLQEMFRLPRLEGGGSSWINGTKGEITFGAS